MPTASRSAMSFAIAAASLNCWKISRPTVCVDVAPSPPVYLGSYGSRVSTDASTTNRMLMHPSPHDVTCKEVKCSPTNILKEKESTNTSEVFEPLKSCTDEVVRESMMIGMLIVSYLGRRLLSARPYGRGDCAE